MYAAISDQRRSLAPFGSAIQPASHVWLAHVVRAPGDTMFPAMTVEGYTSHPRPEGKHT